LPLLEETLQLAKARLGLEHPSTLNTMNSLAIAYLHAGKLDRALPLFEETFKVRKATLGSEHPDTLTSMGNLGQAYERAGKRDLALPLLEETFKSEKATLGPDHPNTLTSMSNLALAYDRAGKRGLALPMLEEGLKLTKAALGPDHPDTLLCMHNLAGLYAGARKLHLALPLWEEALKVMKAKLGPTHPQTLNTMLDLAAGYRSAGKVALALPLLEETFPLMKVHLGVDHPQTLLCMNALSHEYWKARKLDRAAPLLEELVKLRKAKLGPDHTETLEALANLGVTYVDAGRPREAVPIFEEVHKWAMKRPGSFPKLGWLLLTLGSTYSQSGLFTKSESVYRQLVADTTKRLGAASTLTAGFKALVGLSLLQQRKWADAELILRESLTVREKQQPDLWQTFLTKSMLGGALLGRKQYADAEPLLLAGYQGMKQREAKMSAQAKRYLIEALERLVQLYEASAQQDKADVWRRQRDAAKQGNQLWEDLQDPARAARHQFVETKREGALTATQQAQVHILEMKAGTTYVLDLESKAFDPVLKLEDAKGTKLAENDDISPSNLNSRILYVATRGGSYRVIATSFRPGAVGPYILRIRELARK
jgi:hypothetical protein